MGFWNRILGINEEDIQPSNEMTSTPNDEYLKFLKDINDWPPKSKFYLSKIH